MPWSQRGAGRGAMATGPRAVMRRAFRLKALRQPPSFNYINKQKMGLAFNRQFMNKKTEIIHCGLLTSRQYRPLGT